MQRRAFLALTTAASFAPAAARAQTPSATPPLRVGVITIEAAAESFYAQDRGFFEQHGVDVDLQIMASGSAIGAALAGRSLDVGFADVLSAASAHAHGLPLVFVAPALLNSYADPALALVVRGDSPIRGPKDVDGKTISVNALNNITMIPFEAWIDNSGGDSKSVKWIEIPIPEQLDAVQSGRADGTTIGEPFITLAKRRGMRALTVTRNGIAPSYVLAGYIAMRPWTASNPVAVERFAAAITAAGAWANANPAASAPILSKYTKIPLPVVRAMHRSKYVTVLSAAQFQPVIDAGARYGALPKAFPATELFYR